MNDKYIRNENGDYVAELNHLSWFNWFESSDNKRKVAFNQVGNIKISTILLGIDHNFGMGQPLLYETVILGSKHYEKHEKRYHTKKEAIKGHEEVVKFIRKHSRQIVSV